MDFEDLDVIDDEFDDADLTKSRTTMERPYGKKIDGTFKNLFSKAKKGIDTIKQNRQKRRDVQRSMTMVHPPVEVPLKSKRVAQSVMLE